MPVVLLDGSTVRAFVNDEKAFNEAMDARFKETDLNADGSLSRAELRTAFEKLRLLESSFGVPVAYTPAELNALYDSAFEQFDVDRSGNVDLDEFRGQMRDILIAIADGLGASPIQVLVEEGGIFQDAVKHGESAESVKQKFETPDQA